MVQITGRLTKDAEVKQLEENKSVVNFTIAVNDWYKPKDGEAKELVEFIQCSYWQNAGIAKSLKKGAVVEANGRLFATAYMTGNEPKGQINLLAQFVKVHVFAKEEAQQQSADPQAEEPKGKKTAARKRNPAKQGAAFGAEATECPTEDLPF